MNDKWVYVKFGEHHAKMALIVRETVKQDYPAYVLRLSDGTEFTKKQKNTIKMLPTNK